MALHADRVNAQHEQQWHAALTAYLLIDLDAILKAQKAWHHDLGTIADGLNG